MTNNGKKKCLNCGHERQPKDESEFIPASECPKCHAIYEKVEKWHSEKERKTRLLEEEQQRREENDSDTKSSIEESKKSTVSKPFYKKINIIAILSIVVIIIMICFVVYCSGKTTSLEGKVVDGKGQPLAKVKVAAKMSQPIKGYEQFETMTGADGYYKFGKLFPTSEYQLIIYSNLLTVEKKIKIETGPEGQRMMLPEPVMIRFIAYDNGTVMDTTTNLMWAAKDNGSDISCADAKSYCENYRAGGYTDWRLPTKDELIYLSLSGANRYMDIKLPYSWNENAVASFVSSMACSNRCNDSSNWTYRVLPVRSGK